MKILYAVQATGNGHITRARLMANAFKKSEVNVDWIFTGRPKNELFDMEVFADFKVYAGLTFAIKNGKINYLQTLLKNNLWKYIRSLFAIRLKGYDVIISDFEPVSAWAAKLRGLKTIGLSHQAAFTKNIPQADGSLIGRLLLKYFAPVHTAIGLHWNDFNQSLLPPIIDTSICRTEFSTKEILVYYPFVSAQKLIDWFAPFPQYKFHIFHGSNNQTGHEHITLYKFSRNNFQKLQGVCDGVISGAGFELPSEAIHLGQKLLLLPLAKQMEQQSNALALAALQRATIIDAFSFDGLNNWLLSPSIEAQPYPDISQEVVKWLIHPERESLNSLSQKMWTLVNSHE